MTDEQLDLLTADANRATTIGGQETIVNGTPIYSAPDWSDRLELAIGRTKRPSVRDRHTGRFRNINTSGKCLQRSCGV
jgi:hypothetical protein